MSKVSIIIPSRNEASGELTEIMRKTVDDIFSKATGDIEVILVLDGYWPNPPIKDRDNLIVIHRGESKGMRASINAGTSIAKGDYIMKTDDHCMFAEGFDETLKKDCEDNWLVVPRRYSLDAENWSIKPKTPIDYHYLDCPLTNTEYFQFHGLPWPERYRERLDPQFNIDDTMSWQGSMWFMTRKHWDWLGGMDETNYGTFSQEPQEIGNKTWLGGGRIVVNKNTWYAHLHKGKQYGRGYFIGKGEVINGHVYSAKYWMRNSWPERVHDIEWLIEKFWPVPRWPSNWVEMLEEWRRNEYDRYTA